MSVVFVRIPLERKYLRAFNHSVVIGTFTYTCLCHDAYSSPCFFIPSKSVAVTCALTHGTCSHIARTVFLKSAPSFATSVGLVVTPSRTPQEAISETYPTFAVSKKSFIGYHYTAYDCFFRTEITRHEDYA